MAHQETSEPAVKADESMAEPQANGGGGGSLEATAETNHGGVVGDSGLAAPSPSPGDAEGDDDSEFAEFLNVINSLDDKPAEETEDDSADGDDDGDLADLTKFFDTLEDQVEEEEEEDDDSDQELTDFVQLFNFFDFLHSKDAREARRDGKKRDSDSDGEFDVFLDCLDGKEINEGRGYTDAELAALLEFVKSPPSSGPVPKFSAETDAIWSKIVGGMSYEQKSWFGSQLDAWCKVDDDIWSKSGDLPAEEPPSWMGCMRYYLGMAPPEAGDTASSSSDEYPETRVGVVIPLTIEERV